MRIETVFIDAFENSLPRYRETLCADITSVLRSPNHTTFIMLSGDGGGSQDAMHTSFSMQFASTMINSGAELMAVAKSLANYSSNKRLNFSILRIFSDFSAHLVQCGHSPLVHLREHKAIHHTMSGNELKDCHFKCEMDDLLMLLSSGVVKVGNQFSSQGKLFERYIARAYYDDMSSRSITHLLFTAINSFCSNKPPCDTSCIAIKLKKPEKCIVMVGPPKNSQRDTLVVHRLMTYGGKKVVCGESAAMMVSRITGLPLIRKPEHLSIHIPPTFQLAGLDIVTEGTITINSTATLLRNFAIGKPESQRLIKGADGAALIAHMLAEHATDITFLLAHAPNKHNIRHVEKLNNVLHIRSSLISIGRNVRIEYH